MRLLKNQLRTQIRSRRKRLKAQQQHSASQEICHRLLRCDSFKKAHKIALYLPFEGEVPTFLILTQALAAHKACYTPVVSNHLLQFAQIDLNTPLKSNRFGILEPTSNAGLISPHSLDLVLVPLVGFDKQGHRLGMGGGYYDKTFAFRRRTHKPRLIGLAYDFQRLSLIPRSGSDLLLDEIITEKHHYLR